MKVMKILYVILSLMLLSAFFCFFHFNKMPEENKYSKNSLNNFADLLTEEIIKLDKNITIEADLKNQTLVLNRNSKNDSVHLAGIYDDFVNSSVQERSILLEAYAKDFVYPPVIPANFEKAKEAILPNLMPWLWMEKDIHNRKTDKDREKEKSYKVFKDFSPEFKVYLVWDEGDNFVFISDLKLKEWGKTLEDVYAIAMDNLKKRSADKEWELIAQGLYKSHWGQSSRGNEDFNQPTRIVFPDLFKKLSLNGNPVVFLIKRDFVLVTGSNDSRGLLKAADISLKCSEDGRYITGIAYELNNDQWIPFLPDRKDPSFQRLSNLQKTAKNDEYGEQKISLGKIYNEIFVASHSLYKDEKNPDLIRSYSVWAQFIPTLLPKTDYIHLLVRESLFSMTVKRTISVPWEIAFSIAGHLFTDMQVYPQRFKVEGFPSEEELILMEELIKQ